MDAKELRKLHDEGAIIHITNWGSDASRAALIAMVAINAPVDVTPYLADSRVPVYIVTLSDDDKADRARKMTIADHDDAHKAIKERMADVRTAIEKLDRLIGEHNKEFGPMGKLDPEDVLGMLGLARKPF